MKSKFFNTGSMLIAAITLSACLASTETEQTNTSTGDTKNWKPQKGLITFNYSANSKNYQITTRYDGFLRSFGTELKAVSGAPLTGNPLEDVEAQNTIRDAFRAQGLCGDYLHPGILALNYGYSANLGAWVAQVRCSDVAQANI